jgi:endoglucanase
LHLYNGFIHPSISTRRKDGPLDFDDSPRRRAGFSYQAPTGDVGPQQHRGVMLSRRTVLGSIASCGAVSSSSAQPSHFPDEWRSFKARFLSGDGRIIDNANGGTSHSEGQGWGLLFATVAKDEASFDLILNWTSRVLRRPTDSLHAWRYVPTDTPPVQDLNNAVDGDMFIAAALARAGRSWGRPELLTAAAAIGRDILRLLLRQVGSFVVLLPGIEGFETKDAITINPSYYAFPMMAELAKVAPSPRWGLLQRDGKLLLERGRFGQWSLPPDWLRIGKTDLALSPAPAWPPRFSYDAVRVPLWWIWQRLPPGPTIWAIEQFWAASPPGAVPAWVDLKTNEVAPYPAPPGVAAIMRVLRLASGSKEDVISPTVADVKSYYDAALTLLANIAENEIISY